MGVIFDIVVEIFSLVIEATWGAIKWMARRLGASIQEEKNPPLEENPPVPPSDAPKS